MRSLWATGVLTITLLLAVVHVTAAAPPPSPKDDKLQTARSLAENVLGSGTVKSLSIVEDGTKVLMRWEAATYRPNNKLEATRDLLYAEAELATGSILGRMKEVATVRFSILIKDQTVATGENLRGKGVSMVFAPALGGGTHKPRPPSDPKGSDRGGTSAAKD